MAISAYIRRYANWIAWPSLATRIRASDLQHFEDTFVAHADEIIANEARLDTAETDITALEADVAAHRGELIQSVVLGSPATIDLQSIPATFDHLRLVLMLRLSGGTGSLLRVRFNNDSGSNYASRTVQLAPDVTPTGLDSNAVDGIRLTQTPNSGSLADSYALHEITIPYYAQGGIKRLHAIGSTQNDSFSAAQLVPYISVGAWNSTAAVSRITLDQVTANDFATGSRALLYGI